MWMMGYNDSGGDFNMPDCFNGRKLRPLIPRPLPSSSSSSTTTTNNNPSAPTPHCLTGIHGTDFFGLNHHLGSHFGEQNKRELNAPPVVVSSRWNPTPEQLRTLEELYRRGTRTPSAEQIQHITAQLRRYGKIEGKNVFYWFQNHKARERQKRRRQMESSAADHHHHDHNNNNDDDDNVDIEIFKESTAACKTGYEVEQTKNWAASTNCSTLPEEYVSVPRSTKAAMAEYNRQGGWIQFDEAAAGELQQHRRSFVERNATWQMMQLSNPTHLINTNCTTTKTPATTLTAMDQKQLIKAHDLSFFISPYRENGHGFNYLNSVRDEVDGYGESQTLELFPLRSGGDGIEHNVDKVTDVSVAAIDANNLTPYQFFEFLPLKN